MTSREKIIKAAIEIFAKKGIYGATMEEIAKKADINKSMIYYYYGDKDRLYKETLKSILENNMKYIFSNILSIIESSVSSEEKMKKIINVYYDAFQGNIIHTKIIHDSLINHPEYFKDAMSAIKEYFNNNVKDKVMKFFGNNMSSDEFKSFDPRQIIMSIVGMTMIYFVGKPFVSAIFGMNEEEEKKFIAERKDAVINMLLYGIIKNR